MNVQRLLLRTSAMLCALAGSLLLMGSSALAAGDANQSTCPLESEASPGFRAFMPDCRAYELVTPEYTDGGAVDSPGESGLPAISPDGEHVLVSAAAGFAGTEDVEPVPGALYELSRAASGWVAEALDPPASLYALNRFVAASADLSRSLWELPRSSPGEEVIRLEASELAVRERMPGGQVAFRSLGPEVPASAPRQDGFAEEGYTFRGASAELSHILFSVTSSEGELWPGDSTREGDESLYEYVGTEGHEPTLVGVSNDGSLQSDSEAHLISECGTILGSAGQVGAYNAISAAGAILYFTALHGECATPAVNELYARIDGSKTVAISEPAMTAQREAECTGVCREDEEDPSKRSPATFLGASEDGSKVFFTTAQPLLDSDKDNTSDLYEAELGAEGITRLVQISRGQGPTPGSGAEALGITRVSADGSRVYYVARGVLTEKPNEFGEAATQDSYNLYAYDTETGHTSFVAQLFTHGEEEPLIERFSEEDQHECEQKEAPEREECERQLPGEVARQVAREVRTKTGFHPDEEPPAETTRDGEFLIFKSPRPLTGPEDTSTAMQLFEYDAQTQTLARASIGERSTAFPNGYNDDGNITSEQDEPRRVGQAYFRSLLPTEASSFLSVSEDGRVFFESPEALTPQAVNGAPTVQFPEGRENVYEFDHENVHLIAPGDEATELPIGERSRLQGTDLSGRDAFFFSADTLVPQESDTQAGLYDAREGGGFPAPAVAGCAGDACQGALSVPPLVPSPGSAATSPGENLPPPATGIKPTPRSLTRVQKLARALKACRRKAKNSRRACEAKARRRYGAIASPKRGAGAKTGRRR